jgi:hypothetical protein
VRQQQCEGTRAAEKASHSKGEKIEVWDGPKILILLPVYRNPFCFAHCASCYIITAEALQLPLIPPILPEKDYGQFPYGANFAVMGATVLEAPLYPGSSLFSLGVQTDWFDEMVYLRATGDGNYYIHQINTNIDVQ